MCITPVLWLQGPCRHEWSDKEHRQCDPCKTSADGLGHCRLRQVLRHGTLSH